MKITKAIFLLLIITCTQASVADVNQNQVQIIPTYSMSVYDQQINDFYKHHPETQSKQLQTRLMIASAEFLGKPYFLGALGEGPTAIFDKSPLYRTDAFDCVTYVSTVLAMLESDNINQFKQNMLNIQYSNGKPNYATRNHFTSVDWNFNNQKKGYLSDITVKLFPQSYKFAIATIDKPGWYTKLPLSTIRVFKPIDATQTQALMQQLHGLAKQMPIVESKVAYMPLTALYTSDGKPIMSQFDKIPSGVVIEIVRPNWNVKNLIGTNVNVSHLGFGIRIKGVLYFYEASSLQNKVVAVPLAEYLTGYLDSSQTTVRGINIELIK